MIDISLGTKAVSSVRFHHRSLYTSNICPHFYLICSKLSDPSESEICSVVSNSVTQNSPGQNTGVGSLSLLWGIFPIQGSNPGFMHCRQILYQLSHKRSPRILNWVAYPFSSGPSWPRNWTGVSCIAGWLFTNWAMSDPRERIKLAKIGLWPRKCWRLDWKSL